MAEVIHPNLLNIVSEIGVNEVNSLPCNGWPSWWPPQPLCHMIWRTWGLAQGSCPPLAPSLDSYTWAGGQQWHHQRLHVRKLHVWVGHSRKITTALQKCSLGMQRWLCVYLLDWTTGLTLMQKSYGDIIINTSQSEWCLVRAKEVKVITFCEFYALVISC